MRVTSERYTAARLAGAKPILMAYVGTDTAMRCLGKETPQEAHIDSAYNAIEWLPRVLSFGDFTERLSSSDDNPLLSLTEEDMAAYTLTCDNVGFFFSSIAGAESFEGGRLILVQGWDYPGIVDTDFITLFNGLISEIHCDDSQALFIAKKTVNVVEPADPAVDTNTIYGVDNPGTGSIAASELLTYAEMSVFYDEDSWTFIIEVERDRTGVAEDLIAFENDDYGIRLKVSLDSSNQVVVTWYSGIASPPADQTTITSDFTIGTDLTRITVEADDTAGTVTISDNHGNVYSCFALELPVYESQWGSTGSGNTEFDEPWGMTTDASGNLYVCDNQNTRILKFDADGVYVTQWGSAGTGNGQFDATVGPESICVYVDTLVVLDGGNRRFQKFSLTGSYKSQFDITAVYDTSHGSFCVTPSGHIHWMGASNIKYFTFGGTYLGSYGEEHASDWGICSDTLGNIYAHEGGTPAIRKYDSSGTFLTEWATPAGCIDAYMWYVNSTIFLVDRNADTIYIYDLTGTLINSFGETGTGNGQFSRPWGICTNTAGTYIYVGDFTLDRIQRFTSSNSFIGPDFSDASPGTDEYLFMGDDFDGTMTTASWIQADDEDPSWQVLSDNNTAPAWEDVIGTNDVTLVNGTYTSVIETETVNVTIVTETVVEATDEVILPTAGFYSTAGVNSVNMIQPLPYGNLIENADAAVWPCPQIKASAYTYMVAGWPVQPVASGNVLTVYVDGVERTSGWTFWDTIDYQSRGKDIAILWFNGDDPGGEVSVRCNGKWVGGELLTNPVEIIEDFMAYAADLVDNAGWQKNTTSFAAATAFCEANGYNAAGVIQANNSLGYWIKNIMASFLGSFSFNADGEIELSFLPTSYVENVMEDIQEYENTTIKASKKVEHTLNRIITNYARTNSEQDRRFKNGALSSYCRTEDTSNTTQYAGAKTIELNFDWNRETLIVKLLNDILLAMYGAPQWVVTYAGQDFKFLPIDLHDQLTASLSLIRDDTGAVIDDKVYELVEKTINLDDFSSRLTLQGMNTGADTSTRYRVKLAGSPVTLGGSAVYLGA